MHPDFGSALIELTTRCNLSCEHCIHPTGAREKPSDLPLPLAEKIFDSLAEAGVLSLTFTGGEPLLYSHLWEALGAARQRRFLVKMKSNGQLIDKAMAHRLKDAGVYAVDISLYAPDAIYHDRITRRPGSFERSRSALGHLIEEGIKGRILVPLFHPMIDLDAMNTLAQSIPVPIVYDPFVHDTFDHRPAIATFDLTTEELKTYIRTMIRAGVYPRKPDQQTKRPLCKIGTHKTMYVDHQGNFKPCGNYSLPTGSIITMTAEEALENWQLLREELDARRPCVTCEISHFCSPCVAVSFLETGDVGGCSPRFRRFAEAYRAVVAEIQREGHI